jgi:uncharacterized membrane protein
MFINLVILQKNTWYEHSRSKKKRKDTEELRYSSIYIIVKLGMIYCIYYLNWVGLLGYTIATIFAYINMMKEDLTKINKMKKTLKG